MPGAMAACLSVFGALGGVGGAGQSRWPDQALCWSASALGALMMAREPPQEALLSEVVSAQGAADNWVSCQPRGIPCAAPDVQDNN